MKRYNAIHDNDYVSTDRRESPTGPYVLATDVADLEQRYKEAIETLEDCEMWFVELQGTDYNEDGAVTDQRDSIRAVIAKARGKE